MTREWTIGLACMHLALDATLIALVVGRAWRSGLLRRLGVAAAALAAAARSRIAQFAEVLMMKGEQTDEEAGMRPQTDELDELHKQVEDTIADERVRVAHAFNMCFVVVIFMRWLDWYASFRTGDMLVRVTGTLTVWVIKLVGVIGMVRPEWIRRETLSFWHVVWMACLCVVISPIGTEPRHAIIALRAPLHFVSTGAGLVCTKPTLLLITNTVFGASLVASYYSSPHMMREISPFFIFLGEISLIIFKVFLVWGVTLLARARAESEASNRLGQSQRSAIQRLLGLMCDAVAELNEDLCLKGHETSLANLLMHGAGRCLEGASILDFLVPGEDKERFERCIGLNSDREDGAGLFTGHFLDSIGNRLKVAVLHVCFRSPAGRTCHLIGLREDTEDSPSGCGPAPSGRRLAGGGRAELPPATLSEDVSERMQTLQALPRVRRASRTPSSSPSSSASSASFPNSMHPEEMLLADVRIDDKLPVTFATAGLKAKLGTRESPAFLFDAVAESEGPELVARIREGVDLVEAGAVETPYIVDAGEVHLRLTPGAAPEPKARPVRIFFPPPRAPGRPLKAVAVRFGHSRSRRSGRPAAMGTPALGPQPVGLGPQPSCSEQASARPLSMAL